MIHVITLRHCGCIIDDSYVFLSSDYTGFEDFSKSTYHRSQKGEQRAIISAIVDSSISKEDSNRHLGSNSNNMTPDGSACREANLWTGCDRVKKICLLSRLRLDLCWSQTLTDFIELLYPTLIFSFLDSLPPACRISLQEIIHNTIKIRSQWRRLT